MQIASVFVVALLSAVVTGQHLLIAGGGLDKDSGFFWDRLIQLAGGRGRARIGIITAGRSDAEEAAKTLTETLSGYGALVTWIGIHEGTSNSKNDPNVAALVNKQSAIFIDDGEVHRLIKLLLNTNGSDSLVLVAMREKFRRGVISGSGAGAVILSGGALPISGTSYGTLVHGTQAYGKAPAKPGRRSKADRNNFAGCTYIADGGLGFLRNWLIESEFNDATKHGRMIRLLLDTRAHPHSTALGLGLDKNMAMAIYRVGREDEFTEVLGNSGGITIINATNAHYHKTPKLKISGISMTFLSEDDKLILSTDEVLPASWKADLSGEEWHILSDSSDDIFSSQADAKPGNFNRMAKRLFDSSLSRKVQHVSHEKSPELVVEMDRRSGYAFHNDSPSTSKHCISYAGLRVSITERIEA